jgi:hypothetical protein
MTGEGELERQVKQDALALADLIYDIYRDKYDETSNS